MHRGCIDYGRYEVKVERRPRREICANLSTREDARFRRRAESRSARDVRTGRAAARVENPLNASGYVLATG